MAPLKTVTIHVSCHSAKTVMPSRPTIQRCWPEAARYLEDITGLAGSEVTPGITFIPQCLLQAVP